MKTASNERKIRFLAVLAMIAYALVVSNSFFGDWESVKAGFWSGYNSGYGNSPYSDSNNYYLKLSSKQDWYEYADSISNADKTERYGIKCTDAVVSYPSQSVSGLQIGIRLLFAVILFSCYIVIPVNFYKLMRSMANGNIFDSKNVRFIQRLGCTLIIAYLVETCYNLIEFQVNKGLFSFQNYKIEYQFADTNVLLMGIVTLLISEIMVKALGLKEEQDLTV